MPKPGELFVDLGAKHTDADSQSVLLITSTRNYPESLQALRGAQSTAPSPTSAQILVKPEDLSESASDRLLVFHPGRLTEATAERLGDRLGSLLPTALNNILRQIIAVQVGDFAAITKAPHTFTAGSSSVPPSGKVIGAPELQHMVDASLDGWLTTGRYNERFEKALAGLLNSKHVLSVNSGSSANLLALASLTSPKLGAKALQPGDEVITVAAGFPTTVNPILLYGLIPVFVDIQVPTYNIDPTLIEAAVSDKTRAIMVAHTLGNPYDLDAVMRIARKHDLWVVEDCCDALGSTYTPSADIAYGRKTIPAGIPRQVGGFGDIATLSFYPAHHITMGEGGAVFTNSGILKPIIESFRDWGRDCYCAPGVDNTCNKRFCWQLGDLPLGYDHKYTYSHLGYNLKITDMQAACGLAQLDRVAEFIRVRKQNFQYLKERLLPLAEFLILPEATPNSDPSWFGFPITVRESSGVARMDLLQHLDRHKIGSRLLFAGNLTRQPYFKDRNYRISGTLARTDEVMERTFWIGIYPGLSEEALDYSAAPLHAFFKPHG